MQRYFVQLAYNGTAYHGWQIQPNAMTVQESLNKAFSTILREEINLVGAGRTDTGVHASFFVAHFETENEIADTARLVFKLNSFLAKDVRVDAIFRVDESMHARFSALSRTYHYYFASRKQPFGNNITVFLPSKPDVELMNEAAHSLFDYVDFTSFSKLHTDVKTNNCLIMKAEWQQKHDLLVFEIKADRFLRNMVRAIAGTLLKVGQKQITLDEFRQIIEMKDRSRAGASVPGCGLFLSDIEYPEPVNRQLIRKFAME